MMTIKKILIGLDSTIDVSVAPLWYIPLCHHWPPLGLSLKETRTF